MIKFGTMVFFFAHVFPFALLTISRVLQTRYILSKETNKELRKLGKKFIFDQRMLHCVVSSSKYG